MNYKETAAGYFKLLPQPGVSEEIHRNLSEDSRLQGRKSKY
jgi:hypothetical protein